MNFDVTGAYKITMPITTMFLNSEIVIKGENIITFFGESFFMNRCINNLFSPIKYIALGSGGNIPRKEDMKLGNETTRSKCVCTVNLDEKQLILTANFKAKEILGTSEIGVLNDQVLISHDRYSKIDEDFLGLAGECNVEYMFQFTTGALKGGWKQHSIPYVFYTVELNHVVGVYERDSNHWYYQVDSVADLTGTLGAYYFDETTKNLYIRPRRNMSLDNFVKNENIMVQVK